MENEAISEFMLKEHDTVNKILDSLDLEKDIKKKKELFNNLKTKIEKHFFIEEKVIFKIYLKQNQEQHYNILDLLKEHKDILWIMKKTEENLEKEEILDLTDLKNILKEHINFENEFFYPELDKELDDSEKSLILEKINEK